MSCKEHYFSSFASANLMREFFIAFSSSANNDAGQELKQMQEKYLSILKELNLKDALFLRFHLSDVQRNQIFLKEWINSTQALVSIVEQPPCGGSRFAVEAYLCDREYPIRYRHQSFFDAHCIELKNYPLHFFGQTNIDNAPADIQTFQSFALLQSELEYEHLQLDLNTVRTWLYCRDIDNNYAGLVRGRNDFFAEHNLTGDTHFIASTGIEGRMPNHAMLTKLDALSIENLQPPQIEFMHAPTHMPAPYAYKVGFERGCRIIYGDRSHYYISGTASIDRHGEILYPQNVRQQTRRMMENVQVLLQNHHAELTDLKIATVYLRDPADRNIVREELDALNLNCPLIIVQGAVCRPQWLVEIEAFACNDHGDKRFNNYE